MSDDTFYRQYLESLRGQEERYRETRDRLAQNARDALEVEEQRVLDNLAGLLDDPARERVAAFHDELDAIGDAVPPTPAATAPSLAPKTIDDLDVRSLHVLAQMDSALRHSIVEACLMNLRGYAEAFDVRIRERTFLERVLGQMGLLPGVLQQVVDFFHRPRLGGLSIRDLLPLRYKAVLAAVRSTLGLVQRVQDFRRKRGAPDDPEVEAPQPPMTGRELASSVDELTEALSEVHKVLDTRRLSLAEAVGTGVEALRPFVEERGIRLEFEDRTADGVRLFLDRDALANAVGEMVRNAAKYAFPAGSDDALIAVRIEEEAPPSTDVRVVVQDNGAGFDLEVLKKLEKGRASTSGSGDGLGFVRRAAAEHFGKVEIDSRRGQGASVALVLPRRAPVSTHAESV